MGSNFYAPKIRRLGEKLMHHQCWFFGRDIWHTNGNLLIRYGFERFGVPEGKKGGNAYRLQIDAEKELVIWGFGIFYGDKKIGGVFIKRYDFQPFLTRKTKLKLPICQPEELPFQHSPQNEGNRSTGIFLMAEIVSQILKYEKWIDRVCGQNWRKECLCDWENAELSIEKIRRGWRKIYKTTGKI